MKKRHQAFTWLLAFLCWGYALDAYQVIFNGIQETETLELVQSASELVSLADTPPSTTAALRRRADDDIPNIIKALHSLAYYNARVDIQIDFGDPPIVVVNIETGPIYPLIDFQILVGDKEEKIRDSFPYECIQLQDIGITLNTPALPKNIIDAEEALLQLMSRIGHPLASIVRREVIADQSTKSVSVNLYINGGPFALFGPTRIAGQCKVKDLFFRKKLVWKEGCIYDPDKVARTLTALEASGLFITINITHDEKIDESNLLPMNIQVEEGRQRSIGGGLSYNTDLGIGGMGEWENRNIRGMGEKLSLKANVWQIKQEARILYVKPDFLYQNQDLLLQTEAGHEVTKGFTETWLSCSATLERRLYDNLRISYGGAYEWLRTTHSNNNREFHLIKSPFQLLWTNTNNLLEPTLGRTFHLKLTPSYQTLAPTFAYMVNLFTTTAYVPLDQKHRFVLAGKATLGTIWGSSKHSIPPSERFYAGSDNLLRGYRYLTVSPLEDHNKPIGGRSIMVYSLEMRYHATECLGFMTFWDIGNAYESPWPRFHHKQFQSTGVGLRYYTPIGPLRFDVAFPLNRRHKLDPFFQIYVSIGQAF